MAVLRSNVLMMLLAVCLLYLSICVRKKEFIQPDGISVSLMKEDEGNKSETFALSSLWNSRRGKKVFVYRHSQRSMYTILLLLCGDIGSCSGPTQDAFGFGGFINTRGMKIVHQNVRGLFNNLLGLQELIERHRAVDILTVSETHIVDDRYDDNEHFYKIPGYVFINRNRKHGLGGGVAMYIKESIDWVRRDDLENDSIECIWLEVFVKNSKSFLLATCYRPPDGSNYLPPDLNDNLNEMLGVCIRESKEIIMLGDFNVNFLKKNEHTAFKELFRRHGFKQIIKKPTRTTNESSTLIDIIMTNHPQVISKHCVYPSSIGDHDMVGCVRKLNHLKYSPRTVFSRNYSTYDPAAMNEDFKNVNWCSIYMSRNVNTAVKLFNEIVKGNFDRHAPEAARRVRGKPCPWLNADLKKLMIDQDRMLRKARSTKEESHWSSYKKLRNSCNNKLRQAKSLYQKDLLNQNVGNPKNFWSTIKSIFPNKTTRTVLNVNSAKEQEKANIFSKHFSSIVRSRKEKAIPLVDFVWKFPLVATSRTRSFFKVQHQ